MIRAQWMFYTRRVVAARRFRRKVVAMANAIERAIYGAKVSA